MNAYQVFFKIDGYEKECLVIDENEEKAKKNVNMNYLGINDDEITVLPVTSRMIVDMSGFF